MGVDFFHPKNKGIKLIPDIINALIKVVGTIDIISPIVAGVSISPIIGLTKYTSKLILKVAIIVLTKQKQKQLLISPSLAFSFAAGT